MSWDQKLAARSGGRQIRKVWSWASQSLWCPRGLPRFIFNLNFFYTFSQSFVYGQLTIECLCIYGDRSKSIVIDFFITDNQQCHNYWLFPLYCWTFRWYFTLLLVALSPVFHIVFYISVNRLLTFSDIRPCQDHCGWLTDRLKGFRPWQPIWVIFVCGSQINDLQRALQRTSPTIFLTEAERVIVSNRPQERQYILRSNVKLK